MQRALRRGRLARQLREWRAPVDALDVDLVVALTEADVEPFPAALGQGFHGDDHTLRRAVRQRSSVNLFHRATSYW